MADQLSDSSTWVDRYGDLLYGYTRLRVHDPRAAEDLVQETFLAALKARDRFSGQSSEETWLVGILKHKIIDYYRRGSSGINRSLEYTAADDEYFDRKGHWTTPPAEWAVTDRGVETAEFSSVLQSCLGALPDSQRQAFSLRELEEQDSDEICNVMKVTATNLRVMLHRARLALRRCLEAHWFGGRQ